MQRSGQLTLVALMVAGGIVLPTGNGTALGATASTVATPHQRVEEQAALRCHVHVDVRFKGVRFESVGSAFASCAGLLQGQPVTRVAFRRISGRAKPMHHAPALAPPVFGASEIRLSVAGPTLPLQSPRYTPISFALAPDALAATGGGIYTGVARVRGANHDAGAVIAFRQDEPNVSRSSMSGRMTIDLNLGTLLAPA